MIMPHTANEAHASRLSLASRDLWEAALVIDQCFCSIIRGVAKNDLFRLADGAQTALGSAKLHIECCLLA